MAHFNVVADSSGRSIEEFTADGKMRFGFGMVPIGKEARKIYQGVPVPGPWAYMFGLATVIHNGPYEAPAKLNTVEPCDTLEVEGQGIFVVTSTYRGYIELETVLNYEEV